MLQAPSNGRHIAGCFAKGAVSGGAGALLTGAAAVGVGVLLGPEVATGALLLAGGYGLAVLAKTVYTDVSSGNSAGLAFDAGSVLGGAAVSAGTGGIVANAIKPGATPGFSLARSWADRFKPSLGLNPGPWLGKGPDAQSAAQAQFGGGGLSGLLGGCGH